MNKEELKLNDEELHKCIDELKGTQFLSAFCILDWIIKMRNENEELKLKLLEKKCSDKDVEYKEKIKLQNRIDKAIEYIKHSNWLRQDQIYDNSCDMQGWEVKELLEILRGE